MTEHFGRFSSPGQGDPGINALLEYLRSVINYDESAEWTRVAPSIVDGPVRTVRAVDPQERFFNEKDLPALYLVRQKGRSRWAAMGVLVSEDELRLRWVFPPAPQAHQMAREHMAVRVVRSIMRAVKRIAHPAWVHERDLADNDAVMLARATSTSALSLIGGDLDGVVGTRGMTSPRVAIIAASVAAGAYSLDPILVEGLDVNGRLTSDVLTPTSVNGGWLLVGTTQFERFTRVALPAQALTTGSISVGHGMDAKANERGSSVLVHSGFGEINVTEWAQGQVEIQVSKGKGTETLRYEAVELTLSVMERWTTDVDESYALQDVNWSFYGATGNEGDGAVHIMDRESDS